MSYIIKGVRLVMGTFVKIVVTHPGVDEAREAVGAAFNEIYRIHNLMSVYNESSEVSILNKNSFYQGMSRDTKHVIQRASYFSGRSDGVFDITVLPILKLWKEKAQTGRVPTDADIDERLRLVNHKNIIIEGKDIRFRKAGMGITLGGVAKGYAVDRAIYILKKHNIKHALVNAGGDIRVIGGKTETVSWKIAVRNPRNKRRPGTTVELRERAIATSGTYQRFCNDMINPEIGRPSQGVLSSTIIADKAIDADKLNPSLHYLLATILQEQGALDEAIKSLKRALYIDPDFVLAHFTLGNLIKQQGRLKESRKHFDNALTLLHSCSNEDILLESESINAGRLKEIIRLSIVD